MSGINDIKGANFDDLGLGVQKAARGSQKELGQEQFFELMVAQLQNQDPLKPLESNEFMAQVAQFSQVESVQSMERSIANLAQSLQSSQALQASTLVGREVVVAGRTLGHEAGKADTAAVELPASTANLRVAISKPSGEVVKRLELGPQTAGLTDFTWDGTDGSGTPLGAGNYVLTATAEYDGRQEAVDTLVRARVDSVTLDAQSPDLTLNLNGLGTVPMSAVKQLF